ncbi:MAG: ATP-binding protein [Clostridiales bacterium]|nr:ATP-binding protein [Clostridiales bacterium]
MNRNFTIHFKSDMPYVKTVVFKALRFLSESVPKLSQDDIAELRLVFSELLYNAVVHGNKGDINKIVRLEIEIKNNIVYAYIEDEGSGFDYTSLIKQINDEDGLSESGRGVKLAYLLTDKLVFFMPGNAIHFTKKVATHG